jgi:hypothetical protein
MLYELLLLKIVASSADRQRQVSLESLLELDALRKLVADLEGCHVDELVW